MTEPQPEPTPTKGNDWPTILLAGGLALAVVILAGAVLVGVASGHRELTEAGVRAITVAITAAAGVLGFQVGKAALSKSGSRSKETDQQP